MHNAPNKPQASWYGLLNYGLLGWALGAVAVPIYIQVPYLYSRVYDVPPAWIGSILLLSRLLDACLDPLIGLWIDKRKGQSRPYTLPLALATPLLLCGMYGVFFPQGNSTLGYAISLTLSLMVVHLGYSLASIAHQSWGAELGQTDQERATFVAMREGLGILGVVFAVSLALETHTHLIFGVFACMLLLGMHQLLRKAPLAFSHPQTQCVSSTQTTQGIFKKLVREISGPLRHKNFRNLLAIFFCNGLSAALPATLVPFFLKDRLGLGSEDQWVLAVYFLTGAISTFFWVRLASKLGLARAWLMGMVVAVPAFVVVVLLQEGDLYGYLLVCVVTGFALGADLCLPAALVARLIEQNGERGHNEGTYFGLWNWMNKFNLALAPTLALGTLQWFDALNTNNSYPKTRGLLEQIAHDPLIWVYALLPCALKLLAVALLARSELIQTNTQSTLQGKTT